MYIVCAIMVTYLNYYSNTQFESLQEVRQLEGKVIRESSDNYVADFSGHAKVLRLIGDYREVLAPKANCKKAK